MKSKKQVYVKNLRTTARVGVTPNERLKSTVLKVSVLVRLRYSRARMEDDVKNTVDYGRIKRIVEKVCANKEFCLLETIAEQVMDQVFTIKGVLLATVKVEKIGIWPNATPGVKLRFTKELWEYINSEKYNSDLKKYPKWKKLNL